MGRIDYRTKEGQETEVLAQVEQHGGFSVFWVTENQKRAHAAERLQSRGAIIRDGGAFPWCKYKAPNAKLTVWDAITEQKKNHYSDCALHNAPAYPAGCCDCGIVVPNDKLTSGLHGPEQEQ